MAQGYVQDILTRIINVQWGGTYAIIIAEGTYATVDPDKGATIIETKSDPSIQGITGAAVTATLLACAANAGANFASINATAGKPDAAERIEVIVCPKTDSARENWFDMYVKPVSGEREIPTAPFLWLLTTMLLTAPRLIQFKIRFEPHITGPAPEGSEPMVQMIPATAAIGNDLMGYSIWAYRTGRDGTTTLFRSPPEWATDVITNLGDRGLLFGKDPPLIAADIPLDA